MHDLHAWTLTSSLPILTAHVVVTDDCIKGGEAGRVLDHLQGCLAGHFDVAHSTLQLEAIGHVDHEVGVATPDRPHVGAVAHATHPTQH